MSVLFWDGQDYQNTPVLVSCFKKCIEKKTIISTKAMTLKEIMIIGLRKHPFIERIGI